ncbi:iron reductase domain protein [Patellaria atrata CBS 101060]|uniref:Iron reductase domain protein n=1 Tax=Patellaria atrata CBS 101060 TaxID=1346257 RepID=A0A9P4SHS3_9PEZI|nr:iron reductase domain protein [Patellaria atrata CBS 101060]
MRLPTLLLPLVALFSSSTAQAQVSPYTDTRTGISFQGISGSNGYRLGLVLPPANTTSSDVLVQLVGQGKGWAGVSLGGSMLNHLLVAAWPNGQNVMGSLRFTANYGSPPVAPATTPARSLLPILNGTYVNSTHFSYTFLCKSCLTTDGKTFAPGVTSAPIGWAQAASAPVQVTNAATALGRHNVQGLVRDVDLSVARKGEFAKWAGYASATVRVGRRWDA